MGSGNRPAAPEADDRTVLLLSWLNKLQGIRPSFVQRMWFGPDAAISRDRQEARGRMPCPLSKMRSKAETS